MECQGLGPFECCAGCPRCLFERLRNQDAGKARATAARRCRDTEAAVCTAEKWGARVLFCAVLVTAALLHLFCFVHDHSQSLYPAVGARRSILPIDFGLLRFATSVAFRTFRYYEGNTSPFLPPSRVRSLAACLRLSDTRAHSFACTPTRLLTSPISAFACSCTPYVGGVGRRAA